MGIATGHGTEGRCRLVVNVSGAPISPAAARDEGTRNGLRSLSLHSSFRFVLTHHAMSLVVFAVVKSPFVVTVEQTSSPFRLSAEAALLSPFLWVSPGAPVRLPVLSPDPCQVNKSI